MSENGSNILEIVIRFTPDTGKIEVTGPGNMATVIGMIELARARILQVGAAAKQITPAVVVPGGIPKLQR